MWYFIFNNVFNKNKIPHNKPYIPRTVPNIKNINLKTISAPAVLGLIREVTDVKAITITTLVLIILASTAACPITKAPTILNEVPSSPDVFVPASRNISNAVNNIIHSRNVGKGTPCLEADILSTNFIGNNS